MNNYEIAAEEMIKELSKVRAENERILSINKELVEALKELHIACIMDSDVTVSWWRRHKETVAQAKFAIEKATTKQP